MWKSTLKTSITKAISLLTAENLVHQQIRTTFILKRRFEPHMHKKGMPPKKLRSRHYIYDLVKNTNAEKIKNIDVILTSFVDGLGNVGEKVSVKPLYAYNHLLLPGLAVYATHENEDKYKSIKKDDIVQYSSPYALLTIGTLSRMILSVIMNKENTWTLQPWHVRASFRKCGIILPETAIKIPSKPIKGPDMTLEDKEFYVTVTINKKEEVNVRCKIHHWSTLINDKLPYVENFWTQSRESLFPEDAPILEQMRTASVKNINQ